MIWRPKKPEGMNGDGAALWDAIRNLGNRIDALYLFILGGFVAVLIAIFLAAD